MNSKHVKEKLSAYIDKDLDAEEMQVVEEHLTNCAECRQEYEDLQETVLMLSSLEEVIPPASFRRELRAELEKSTPQAKKFSLNALIPNWMKTLRRNQLIPGIAALVLLIIIIPIVGSNLPGGMGSADQAAESIMMEESGAYNRLAGGGELQKTDDGSRGDGRWNREYACCR